MTSGAVLLLFLTLQRLAELVIASRNTRALLARGALECGAGHYPVMIAMHATWLLTLWIFGWNRQASFWFVVVFILLQVGRVWVLTTLGERWTTRIMVLRGAPLVESGPFRFLRHPNYLIVALEIPCVSLALGLVWHAAIFTSLNLIMLWWRIRVENQAHATRDDLGVASASGSATKIQPVA